jgi:hypothetical protein
VAGKSQIPRRQTGDVYLQRCADTAEAGKLVFMLGQIGKLLEAIEIEARLKALEVRANELPSPR